MSQPPPPPNQPSSGGFGAPQEPPQGPPSGPPQGPPPGGYGYPQQPGTPPPPGGQQPPPPQQPPQAPQQPPQAPGTPPPGGYGYPQQPPGGYGYPQQPPGGYGYPQQPGQPGGFGAQTSPPQGPYGQQMPGGFPTPPPGGKGGGSNSKVIGIVAAVVAVLLVAGVGVFFLTKDDSKNDESKGDSKGASQNGGEGSGDGGGAAKPKSTKAKQIIDMDAPKVNDLTSVKGAWATDKVFAKSGVNEMIGFDLATKKQKYKLPLKGPVCSTTKDLTKDGKAALVVGETISNDANCTRMVIVDIDKGKIVWDQTMPNADTRSNDNVAISGDTVASSWSGGSVGYKISTKKQLWKATPSTCRDAGYVGGEEMVAVVECGGYDNPQITVQKLDQDTGKAKWKYQVPKGAVNVRVASVKPLVLVTGSGGTTTPTDVMAIGDDKKLKSKISIGERYNKPCSSEIDTCGGMAVTDDQIYLSTPQHAGSADGGRTNEVMAFSFKTGQPVWKSPAGPKREIFPFGTQDGNVLAYRLPSYESGGAIVSIEPKKGKQTKLLQMPVTDYDKGEKAFSVSSYGGRQAMLFAHNRFFLWDDLLSERRSSQEGTPKLAAGWAAD